MTMIERASAIASAEFQGERSEQAAAAGRLATVLRESASGLNVDGVDPRTGAQLERLRRTLEEEGGAFEDLGGAIERRSDVAFDAARELVRASRRKLNTALATFKRAGYAVQ
jgi:hypothetical protein